MSAERHAATTPFLTAEWRHLLMLNYPVDPALLAPHVPDGTELDLWEGSAYLSLVGFLFLDTKLKGVPIPFHRNFEEINLRFYIRREDDDEVLRGVVFLREIVPRRAIAWVANALYEEHYVTAKMTHTITDGRVEYTAQNGRSRLRFGAAYSGDPEPLVPGSAEEFFAEHYWGYTRRADGATSEYRVDHPPWKAWRVGDGAVEGDLAVYYGDAFAEVLAKPPTSAFLADGSPVAVFDAVKLTKNIGTRTHP